MPISPRPSSKRFSREGFQPLGPERNDNTMDIPLERVVSHGSTGARRPGNASPLHPTYSNTSANNQQAPNEKKHGFFHRGHRKAKGGGEKKKSALGGDDEDEEIITKMGRFYTKFLNFSIVTRYFIYILPVGLILLIPLLAFRFAKKGSRIDATFTWELFLWLEIVWLGLWASKLVSKLLPYIFETLVGVVSSGVRKYSQVIKKLEIPLSLVGWAAVSLATFYPITVRITNNQRFAHKQEGRSPTDGWVGIVLKILAAALIASIVYLAEQLFVQLISINYHRTQFDARIKENKRHIHLLGLLYDASRSLFPAYCPEFEEEDYIINDVLDFNLGSRTNTEKRASNNPLRLVQNVGRFGNQVTAAFGNVAQEITGKEVFAADSAHSVVVEALEKTRSAEALARRLWMSFVVEGRDSLFKEDIVEVLGSGREEEAEEIFDVMDGDGNGDISLEEMITMVTQWGRDRTSIAHSMHDVDSAVHALNSLLLVVAGIIIIFIFVGFLNANFTTTLATAGTILLSLSFIFVGTAQEILLSCIFLFSKHPYDVGDRVDVGEDTLTVESIALLYTIFKRTTNGKMVQISNQVLNGLWVDNVSRSNAMFESFKIYVNFDTSFEDIELLRHELENFVKDKDNSRDFLPEITISVNSVMEMDKLELTVTVKSKSNWANGALQAQRRNRFFCALVLALRKIPIYGPGAGAAGLGEKANPSYSVTISDSEAKKAKDDFDADKESKRMVPTPKEDAPASDAPRASGIDYLAPGQSEAKAIGNLTARTTALDVTRDDIDTSRYSGASGIATGRTSTDNDSNLLRRASSSGKRRAASSDHQAGGHVPTIVEPQRTGEEEEWRQQYGQYPQYDQYGRPYGAAPPYQQGSYQRPPGPPPSGPAPGSGGQVPPVPQAPPK